MIVDEPAEWHNGLFEFAHDTIMYRVGAEWPAGTPPVRKFAAHERIVVMCLKDRREGKHDRRESSDVSPLRPIRRFQPWKNNGRRSTDVNYQTLPVYDSSKKETKP